MDKAISIEFADERFLADTRRALFWPRQNTLVVADLHIGKAMDFTARGTLLPPYELNDMHERLMELIDDYTPRRVLALGDSFHCKTSSAQLQDAERTLLDGLIERVQEWIFVEGNHDAGGFVETSWRVAGELVENAIRFCHQPENNTLHDLPTVFGHYHPKFSRHSRQGGRLAKPCFIWNERALILPAFGTYTGGLDVDAPAIQKYFAGSFTVATAETQPKPVTFHFGNAA